MFEKMIELQQKRRSKKGGFTLVELIVVLVILAILAALLIPALTGYIDKAKDKQIVAETRQAVMAAQTLYDEKYGQGTTTAGVDKDVSNTDFATKVVSLDKIYELAEINGKGSITNIVVKGAKIDKLTWKNTAAKKQCEYDADKGTYEVSAVSGS